MIAENKFLTVERERERLKASGVRLEIDDFTVVCVSSFFSTAGLSRNRRDKIERADTLRTLIFFFFFFLSPALAKIDARKFICIKTNFSSGYEYPRGIWRFASNKTCTV